MREYSNSSILGLIGSGKLTQFRNYGMDSVYRGLKKVSIMERKENDVKS